MHEKHLTYFKVENFKRFDSFEMNDIGQFNLIVGDNNVGKTSVLEALLFDDNIINFRDNLFAVLFEFRKIADNTKNPIQSFFYNDESPKFLFSYKNEEIKEIILLESELKKIILTQSNKGLKEYPYNPETAKENIPYVPFHLGYDQDLITYYSKAIQKSRQVKKDFIFALKALVPTIENVEISLDSDTPILLISQTDKDEILPLSLSGEGTIKLIRILMKILVNQGKRLMIDEVDAGVHYKKFKDFWRTVLLAAKENDVQLFMTTHNIECLQYFKEVLEETEMIDLQKEARCFEMVELPNGSVKSYTRGYEEFANAIDLGNNIRGGKL